MLNKMIKALEGARSELDINLSKVLQIQNSLNLASELLDEITINYSEVVFNENYIDEVMYGVIKANDNYWRFEHEVDDEDLTEWLINNEFKAMDSVQIFKIYNNFFRHGEYGEKRNPNFFNKDYTVAELIEEIDKAIDTLKEYVNNKEV